MQNFLDLYTTENNNKKKLYCTEIIKLVIIVSDVLHSRYTLCGSLIKRATI